VAESQSRTVLSPDPDAICFPSGENTTSIKKSEWPLRILPFFQYIWVTGSDVEVEDTGFLTAVTACSGSMSGVLCVSDFGTCFCLPELVNDSGLELSCDVDED
jgi:hypothetical protein